MQGINLKIVKTKGSKKRNENDLSEAVTFIGK